MDKKYYAFISYKREDEEWAKWLQHKLEHYKLPSNLNGRTDLPKEIRPVFKDTSELNPGNLPQQIHEALEQSKHLIVICSPRSAKSEWVNREVEAFIGMGKTDYIIPFIIDGKAFAKDSDEECFPEALRNLPAEQEILGANIGEMGRDAAAVKVVARMFGLRFDELWQRYEREQRKKRNKVILGVTALALIALGVAGWIWRQNVQLKEKDWKMMAGQARFVSEKANDLIDKGLPNEAQRILLEVLPKDLESPDRPCVPDAERALRHALSNDIVSVEGEFSDANFSPDGKTIVAVCHDTICILDANNGKVTRVIGRFEGAMTAEFSPDGKTIVFSQSKEAEDDLPQGIIGVMDVDSGKLLFQLMAEKYLVSAGYSPDGKQIVSYSEGVIQVWDVERRQELLRLEGDNPDRFTRYRHTAKFSPDGKQILEVSDFFIRVWDVEKGQEVFAVTTDESFAGFTCACYSPDGKTVLASSADGVLRIWNSASGVKTGEMRSYVGCLDVTRNGKIAFELGGETGDKIQVLEVGNRDDKMRMLTVSYDDCSSYYNCTLLVRFASDGSRLLTISGLDMGLETLNADNGPIKIWKVYPIDEVSDLKENISVYSDEFSPDGKLMVSTTYSGTTLLDVETGKEVMQLKGSAFSICPDGKHLASVVDDAISVLDVETGKEVMKLEDKQESYVISLSYSPDGKQIASASSDRTIRIWDTETGKLLRVIDRSGKDENDSESDPDMWFDDLYFNAFVSFSPDGKSVLYHDYLVYDEYPQPTILYILDAESGKVMREFTGHNDRVESARFSANGKHIISSSWDGTMRIWDVESGEEIFNVEVSELWGQAIPSAFSSDGKYLVAPSEDGSVKLWNWPSLQDLIDQTRERFKDRPLTPEERHQYYLE